MEGESPASRKTNKKGDDSSTTALKKRQKTSKDDHAASSNGPQPPRSIDGDFLLKAFRAHFESATAGMDEYEKYTALANAAWKLKEEAQKQKKAVLESGGVPAVVGGLSVPPGVLGHIAGYCATRTCQNNFAFTCQAAKRAVLDSSRFRRDNMLWPTMPNGADSARTDVTFSPDGGLAAIVYEFSNKLEIWDRSAGLLYTQRHGKDLLASFSPDNATAVLYNRRVDRFRTTLYVVDLHNPERGIASFFPMQEGRDTPGRVKRNIQFIDKDNMIYTRSGNSEIRDIPIFRLERDDSGKVAGIIATEDVLASCADENFGEFKSVAAFAKDPYKQVIATVFGSTPQTLLLHFAENGTRSLPIEVPFQYDVNIVGVRPQLAFSYDGKHLLALFSNVLAVFDSPLDRNNASLGQPKIISVDCLSQLGLTVPPRASTKVAIEVIAAPGRVRRGGEYHEKRRHCVVDIETGEYEAYESERFDDTVWKLLVEP